MQRARKEATSATPLAELQEFSPVSPMEEHADIMSSTGKPAEFQAVPAEQLTDQDPDSQIPPFLTAGAKQAASIKNGKSVPEGIASSIAAMESNTQSPDPSPFGRQASSPPVFGTERPGRSRRISLQLPQQQLQKSSIPAASPRRGQHSVIQNGFGAAREGSVQDLMTPVPVGNTFGQRAKRGEELPAMADKPDMVASRSRKRAAAAMEAQQVSAEYACLPTYILYQLGKRQAFLVSVTFGQKAEI